MNMEMWRLPLVSVLLLAAGCGLVGATFVDGGGGGDAASRVTAGLAVVVTAVLVAGRHDAGATQRFAPLLAVAGALVLGLGLGQLRLVSIDSGALMASDGAPVATKGHVTSPPRQTAEGVRFRVDTREGRALVVTPEVPHGLDPGTGVEISGHAATPGEWETGNLLVHGIRTRIETGAGGVRIDGDRRGGIAGLADSIRRRAETALAVGTDKNRAALTAGFVLGQDDQVDPALADDFRRSGLAHLSAVSGQNVLLLMLLATPLLALTGLGLPGRASALAVLVVAYVLVTGAGPSIQRAGIMGLAGLAALVASRPADRWHALALAAVATLALNPRVVADVGWQLSFAAVAGITLWTGPLAKVIAGKRPGQLRAAFASGVAMTVAATVATAPLMAVHFEVVTIAALPANVAALPAVAPVMWAGMLAAAAGQLPGFPPADWLAAITSWVAGVGAGYIAAVARWFAGPDWAQIDLRIGATAAIALALLLAALMHGGVRSVRALAGQRLRVSKPVLVGVAATVVIGAAVILLHGHDAPPPLGEGQMRLVALDVGQGDAILIQVAEDGREHAMLIDTGPPDTRIDSALRHWGVSRLDAVVATHGDSDHVGALDRLLSTTPVGQLIVGRPDPDISRTANRNSTAIEMVSAGQTIRIGRSVGAEVIRPSVPVSANAANATNVDSVVLHLRYRRFDALLTGDAEFGEAAIPARSPVELLKVAHHGSADPGLATALTALRPSIALISVGADNRYGHPVPQVLADLDKAAVPVLRTDTHGDIAIVTDGRSWRIDGR